MVETGLSTDSHTEPDAPVDPPHEPTPRWAWMLAGVLVALPVLRMVGLVLDAHQLPYNDYWPMMDTLIDDGGGFVPSGLFSLHNEHPLVVAKLLYWVNLKVTGGSNVALGLVVIGVGLGQVAVVAVLARDLGRRWRLAPPLLVAAAGFLIFGRHGAWHFVKSMSGAAWLTANLFTLLAIWAQVRGRLVLPIVFAALATVSYGTGLATWPVVLLVGGLSGARARHLAPTLAVGAAMTIWIQVQLADIGTTASDRPPLLEWASLGAEVIGAYLFPSDRLTDIRVGKVLVALGIAGGLVAVHRRVRGSAEDARLAAPWVGLVAYGAGMALLLAAGRNGFLWNVTQGRYSAIGALTCVGVIGLGLALLPSPGTPARLLQVVGTLMVIVLYIGVWRGGAADVRSLDSGYAVQDLLSVGLETKVFNHSRLWLGNLEVIDSAGFEDRLERSGHDFRLDGSLDCGLLGTTVDPVSLAAALPPGVTAEIVRWVDGGDLVPLATVVEGWVVGASIDCAVLIAPDGEVVGAGGHGSARLGYGGPGATDIEGREWFSALAPLTDDATLYLRLDDEDELYPVPAPT